MKKLIVLGVTLLLWLCVSSAAYAVSANDTIGVLLTVSETFTFGIDENVVDMGTVAEGASGVMGFGMTCGTNRNLPWTIQMKSSAIASGANTIPLSGFKVSTFGAGEQCGVGTFVTDKVLTMADQTVYTAATAEASDTWVKVSGVFAIAVPYNQPAGTYAATVTATMTE